MASLMKKAPNGTLDLPTRAFLILRERFFDANNKPRVFKLRDKLSTQDDPLDEYIARLLTDGFGKDFEIVKASPLVSPDLAIYDKESFNGQNIQERFPEDIGKIVALEVKKLNRTGSGSAARRSGLDYNTTPPCGKVRVYTQRDESLDVRAFYVFVCQEKSSEEGIYQLTALALCDGNALNMDFDLYLSAVETREKEINLGTYSDGLNRNRPMFVFSNPLGLSEMDHKATLIHPTGDLDKKCNSIGKVFRLVRRTKNSEKVFWCYRYGPDIKPNHIVVDIYDFPTPSKRTKETQSRGKLRLMF